jgi:hypothetical protein
MKLGRSSTEGPKNVQLTQKLINLYLIKPLFMVAQNRANDNMAKCDKVFLDQTL